MGSGRIEEEEPEGQEESSNTGGSKILGPIGKLKDLRS